jgi:AcrR family transcriptional regulator
VSPPPPTATRLDRSRWTRAALEAIADGGLANVAVERIARDLGATKGSFYWHFKDRAELVEAALDSWVGQTDTLIERFAEVDDPGERLRTMLVLVLDDSPGTRVEGSLVADAGDPVVGERLARVTATRVRYIETIFDEAGHPDARERALLLYASFLGIIHLRRTAPGVVPTGEAFRSYVDDVLDRISS